MGEKVDKWEEVGHSGATDPGEGVSSDEDGRRRTEVFLGEYFHSLDEKGRVVMPSGFRRLLEDGCVVTKGQDGQLAIFPTAEFEALAAEVREKPQNRSGRRFSRTVFSGADLQTLDKAGRVLVKPDLRDFASLETSSEIAVLGVFDHVELWNKDLHLSDRAVGDESYLEEDE
ncbi:MAG: division/cell wall cluster transcriptional repressor MraZ [Acidimicrobiia bacterium]